MKLAFEDPSVYALLVEIGSEYGVDPSASLEMEDYFRALLLQYDGELASARKWIEQRVSQVFVALDTRPRWIQGANWPIQGSEPAIFVGQIDLDSQREEVSRLFHDDTSLYVFLSKLELMPIVIVQQF